MIYVSYILVALAAICNSIMDITSFHYDESIFSKFNPQYWNPQISWKNKYIDGDVTKGMRKIFFGLFDYPTFLTDSWHCFKSLLIFLMVGAIVLYKPLFNIWIDFVLIGCVWNVFFNSFFNHFFKK